MFLSSLISCFQSSHQGSTRDDQASLFDNSIGDIYETKEENIAVLEKQDETEEKIAVLEKQEETKENIAVNYKITVKNR